MAKVRWSNRQVQKWGYWTWPDGLLKVLAKSAGLFYADGRGLKARRREALAGRLEACPDTNPVRIKELGMKGD